jgi:hypothetical protein
VIRVKVGGGHLPARAGDLVVRPLGRGLNVRVRKRLLWLVPTALVVTVGLLSLRAGVYLPAHRHCIKEAGLALHNYADAHGGRFPDAPGGYGDALPLAGNDETWHALTGPGYDPAALRDASAGGRGLPEAECGRVYVRGLRMAGDSRVAILFDKASTPGGDHCHLPFRLWATCGREVLYRDGSMRLVRDSAWPAFAAEQIELLVAESVPRAEAERLYAQASP